MPFKLPNPSKFVPRPYNVGADVGHLEKIRPLGQSIGIALDKASRAEGGPASPLSSDPRGNPDILKRLSFKTRVPAVKPVSIKVPKFKP